MVKVSKLSAYILFFILVLIYFMPKENIYYMAEKELEKYGLVVSNEVIQDNGISLNLKNGTVFYNSVKSADVDSINIKTFFIYNSISVENINLSDLASSFIPLHINNLDIHYSVFNPLNVVFGANGEFGEAKGKFNILDKNLVMVLTPSELMKKDYKNTFSALSKNENGEYEYDKTF